VKRLGIIGLLLLAACGGPAQAKKPVVVTQVATVEDCTIYELDGDEKLVICKTSNPALVRR